MFSHSTVPLVSLSCSLGLQKLRMNLCFHNLSNSSIRVSSNFSFSLRNNTATHRFLVFPHLIYFMPLLLFDLWARYSSCVHLAVSDLSLRDSGCLQILICRLGLSFLLFMHFLEQLSLVSLGRSPGLQKLRMNLCCW